LLIGVEQGMRFFMSRLFLVLSFLSLFACGAGSIYNSSYYSETELGDELFRVTFQGGRAPMTGDLCLLRCAEVTLSAGKKYFQVVDSESGNSFNSFPSSYPFQHGQINDDPFVNDIAFVTKTIRVMDKEPATGFGYEANLIKISISKKYEINK
jgi:hypothetical protein